MLTPERVSLSYDIAGIGSRSAAAAVDVLIQAFGVIVLAALLVGLGLGLQGLRVVRQSGDGADTLTVILVAVFVVGLFVVLWGYYLVFEIAWSGQTPGKRLLGIRAIRENGYPLRPGDAMVRNLVRIVDGPPFMYLVGILVMLLNSRSKRFGDFAAGTVVVREAREKTLATLVAAEPEPPVAATRLSAEEATLVRDFLARRAKLAPGPRAEIGQRLADVLGRRHGLEAERGDLAAEAFLEGLVGGG